MGKRKGKPQAEEEKRRRGRESRRLDEKSGEEEGKAAGWIEKRRRGRGSRS